MEIKAIETRHNGYRFRSRLEARWAVFFETLGVPYEYEKEGYDLGQQGWYLPDFFLEEQNIWVEVKGKSAAEDFQKLQTLGEGTHTKVFLVTGQIGEHVWHGRDGHELYVQRVLDNKEQQIALENMLGHKSTYAPEWGNQVRCPICHNLYVHIENPLESTITPWSGHGNAIGLPMWCENGHKWILRFGFHKGYSFVAIENLAKKTKDLGLWLASGDTQKYQRAITAARSARFNGKG